MGHVFFEHIKNTCLAPKIIKPAIAVVPCRYFTRAFPPSSSLGSTFVSSLFFFKVENFSDFSSLQHRHHLKQFHVFETGVKEHFTGFQNQDQRNHYDFPILRSLFQKDSSKKLHIFPEVGSWQEEARNTLILECLIPFAYAVCEASVFFSPKNFSKTICNSQHSASALGEV